jgi:hypothetical protein
MPERTASRPETGAGGVAAFFFEPHGQAAGADQLQDVGAFALAVEAGDDAAAGDLALNRAGPEHLFVEDDRQQARARGVVIDLVTAGQLPEIARLAAFGLELEADRQFAAPALGVADRCGKQVVAGERRVLRRVGLDQHPAPVAVRADDRVVFVQLRAVTDRHPAVAGRIRRRLPRFGAAQRRIGVVGRHRETQRARRLQQPFDAVVQADMLRQRHHYLVAPHAPDLDAAEAGRVEPLVEHVDDVFRGSLQVSRRLERAALFRQAVAQFLKVALLLVGERALVGLQLADLLLQRVDFDVDEAIGQAHPALKVLPQLQPHPEEPVLVHRQAGDGDDNAQHH